jgi:hypothetical protein
MPEGADYKVSHGVHKDFKGSGNRVLTPFSVFSAGFRNTHLSEQPRFPDQTDIIENPAIRFSRWIGSDFSQPPGYSPLQMMDLFSASEP